MGVPQYTTPQITLTFTDLGYDLTEMAHVVVSISARGYAVHLDGDKLTVSADSITVRLDQADTGRFGIGPVAIQANWVDALGHRVATEIAHADISGNLYRRVIE